MKIYSTVLAIIFTLLVSRGAMAQKYNCASIKSPQDILNCALENHPEVQISNAAVNRDQYLKNIAKQRPNPELDAKILASEESSADVLNTEIGLLHTVELGGKRKNRIRQALANESFTKAQNLESRELTALNTVLALHRLRQLRSELATVNEAISTFGHISANFKSRPKLAPEQEVSSSVFKLARDEYGLKRTVLIQEQIELLKFLELATGLAQKEILRHLPGAKRNWPKFKGDFVDSSQNSLLAKSQAEKTLAEANHKLAISNAWPDFKLGPTIETQSGLPGRNIVAGANLSLGLPILSLNRGGIEYSKRDEFRSKLAYQLTLQKNENERAKQVQRYQMALRSLFQTRSGSFHQEHESIEKYFNEGLISSSLVIESHRQIFDLSQSVHEQELTAMDALWRLYIIDGKLADARL